MKNYSPKRGFFIVAALLTVMSVLHYVLDLACMVSAQCHLPVHWVTRFACLCPLAGLLVGLAMLLRNAWLCTYGLVLWLLFPLGATIDQFLVGQFDFEFSLSYQLVLLFAGPLAIASGLWKRLEVLRAFAACWALFFVKGIVNYLFADAELQIWLFKMLGDKVMRDNFLVINILGLLVALLLLLADHLLLRRRRSLHSLKVTT